MSDQGNIMIARQFYDDLSGVDGDGLGEGEVAFEGEERCWEEDCPAPGKTARNLARRRPQKRSGRGLPYYFTPPALPVPTLLPVRGQVDSPGRG